MTYHDKKVAEILEREARIHGRETTLVDASTLGAAGERVTTVVFDLAPLARVFAGEQSEMLERRAQVDIEDPVAGNRTASAGLIVSTTWRKSQR